MSIHTQRVAKQRVKTLLPEAVEAHRLLMGLVLGRHSSHNVLQFIRHSAHQTLSSIQAIQHRRVQGALGQRVATEK